MLRKLFQRWLTQYHQPASNQQLLEQLQRCCDNKLISQQSYAMITGVIDVDKLKVRDVMIPRSQMICINQHYDIEEIMKIITSTRHSRYPVMGENKDQIKGVILAKDLLTLLHQDDDLFSIENFTHTALLTPESKPLDDLLQEFKHKRQHMAIVIDEYGGVAGLVTMEDIIELIVGDIEDEYDKQSVEKIIKTQDQYMVNGATTLSEFNEYFNTNFSSLKCDTIGGYISLHLGYIPQPQTHIDIEHHRFKVIRVSQRKVHLIAYRPSVEPQDEGSA